MGIYTQCTVANAHDAPFNTESPFHDFYQNYIAENFDAEDHTKNN